MTSSDGYTSSLKRHTFVTTRFAFLRIRFRTALQSSEDKADILPLSRSIWQKSARSGKKTAAV